LVKLGGQVEVEHFENCLAATQISHRNYIQTFWSPFSKYWSTWFQRIRLLWSTEIEWKLAQIWNHL